MKKDIILSLRKRSLLLLFMGSFFALSATPSNRSATPSVKKSKAVIKDDSTKIIFSNWINEMEGLCVFLNQNNLVEMTVNIVTQTNDISAFPDIHYEYSFNGEPVAVSEQLTSSSFAPYKNNYGEILYIATFTHYMNYSGQCITKETTLDIDYSISLVTPDGNGGFAPYPITSNIGTLFPDNTQLGTGGNNAGFEMGDKVVCCNQGLHSAEMQFRQTASHSQLSQMQITPNPFSEELSIETTPSQNTMALIRIFDLTGKVWYQEPLILSATHRSTQTISTAHFPPGIYFYKVNEETPLKLIKTQ